MKKAYIKIQTNVCIFVDKREEMCYNMQTDKETGQMKSDRKAALRHVLFILFYDFHLVWKICSSLQLILLLYQERKRLQ